MKVEIVHDALAKRIYDKAQDEDKERLKAASFIMQRYNLYINEDDATKEQRLIPDEDLVWVTPFVDEIELSSPILEFIRKSERVAKRKSRTRKALIISTIASFSIAAIVSIILLWQNANYHEKQEKIHLAYATNLQMQIDTIQKFESLINELRGQLQLQDDDIRTYLVQLKATNDSLQVVRDSLSLYTQDLENDYKRLEDEQRQSSAQVAVLVQKKHESEKQKQEAERKREEAERKLNQAQGEITKVESRVLSAKAVAQYSEDNKKEAFHLAAAAWRRDPDNKEACRILKNLSDFHQGFGSGGSYETIIRQLSRKHYGSEWSESKIKKHLD